MEANRLNDRQLMVLVFGVPLLTAVIVVLSMYAGYTLTRLDKPTQVTVMAAPPTIDVNVPPAEPPQIQVSAPTPQVSIQVPVAAPPTVNVTTPPAAVTFVDREHFQQPGQLELAERIARTEKIERKLDDAGKEAHHSPAVASALTPSPTLTLASPLKPIKPVKADRQIFVEPAGDVAELAPLPDTKKAAPTAPTASTSATPIVSHFANLTHPAAAKPAAPKSEATLDTLYECANGYIESYCRKQGLDPTSENRKWDRKWRAGLDQAMADNIDTSEQSYINRMVIIKRDYFNVEKTSPDKVVEACHLLLRYRDGQLAWLQAMKDAMTQENLNKTVAFLAAGP